MEVQGFFFSIWVQIFLKEIWSKIIASFFHSEVWFNSVCIRKRITSDVSFEIKRKGQWLSKELLTHYQCIKEVTICWQKSCQLIRYQDPAIAELDRSSFKSAESLTLFCSLVTKSWFLCSQQNLCYCFGRVGALPITTFEQHETLSSR